MRREARCEKTELGERLYYAFCFYPSSSSVLYNLFSQLGCLIVNQCTILAHPQLRTCANIYLKYFFNGKSNIYCWICTLTYGSNNGGDHQTAGVVTVLDICLSVGRDLFTMSQMNHLLKINMIYFCPGGLLHDVIEALMFHFIVVVSDVLQIFTH